MTGLSVLSTARNIVVKRDGIALNNGSTYVVGETLSVSISLTTGDVVLEASGGATLLGGEVCVTAESRFIGPATSGRLSFACVASSCLCLILRMRG